MHRIGIRSLSIFSTMALVLGGFQTSSEARTVLAGIGRPTQPGDYGCLAVNASSLKNTCGHSVRIEIPLVVDDTGPYVVRVNAEGANTSANVTCAAVGVTDGARQFEATGQRSLDAFGSPRTITLTGVSVPSLGTMFVYCDILPNGRVNTVNFDRQ